MKVKKHVIDLKWVEKTVDELGQFAGIVKLLRGFEGKVLVPDLSAFEGKKILKYEVDTINNKVRVYVEE